jgi:hypothetical protein
LFHNFGYLARLALKRKKSARISDTKIQISIERFSTPLPSFVTNIGVNQWPHTANPPFDIWILTIDISADHVRYTEHRVRHPEHPLRPVGPLAPQDELPHP